MAAMSLPTPTGGANTASSRVVSHVPQAVYQTNIINGVQDSSTQMEICIALSDAAYVSMRMHEGDLHEQIMGGLRRFDNRPVELYDPDDGVMKLVKLHPSMFTYTLDHVGPALRVQVHRKYLPVSKAHSDAPVKFVWLFMCVGEVVATTPFTVGSKEPRAVTAPRPPPRRLRAPSTRKPFMALPDALDAAIDKVLRPTRGTKRLREEPTVASDAASAASDVPEAVEEEGVAPPPAQVPRVLEPVMPVFLPPPPVTRGVSGGSLGPWSMVPPPPLHSVSSLPPLDTPELPAMGDLPTTPSSLFHL